MLASLETSGVSAGSSKGDAPFGAYRVCSGRPFANAKLALRWLAAIVALWLAVLSFAALAADGLVAIPRLEGRVTDLTGTLTRDQRAQLESRLAALERDKGAQLAVLLLPTTQPESIEQFGIRLAESWRIGRRGVDDGIIVIVAVEDRRVRIEVGYGLEGVVPDVVGKRIIEEIITPRFRQGDIFGGLDAATDRLGRIVAGEALPAPQAKGSPGSAFTGGDWPVVLLFILAALARVARAAFGLLGALLAAGVAGWLALLLFGHWLAAAVAALLVFVLAFARGGGPGWHAGGGSGGGWSGGSGGFSGGGGGFGGGGASGRW